MLTIIGYSVNDTIVIFDRIRENLGRTSKAVSFWHQQTSAFTINTSLTGLLFLLGGSIFFHLYSSICIATELWYIMRLHLGKNRLIKK